MTESLTLFGGSALLILLLPDLIVLWRTYFGSPCAPHSLSEAAISNPNYTIDLIVPVKVPLDEYFVAEWPQLFKEKFSKNGNRLMVSSNGSWSSATNVTFSGFDILHTEGGGTKIKNLEKAIKASSGEIIAVFDVDARPLGNVDFELIEEQLTKADCIQGANIVTLKIHNPISRFCEYESLLSACISETFAFGKGSTSQFRGTNAYFRAMSLKELGFPSDTALEDIDATIRILLRGGVIRFDPRLIASESPPASGFEFLRQRARWSFGWGHLSRLHLLSLIRSKNIAAYQIFCVAGYLIWVTFFLPLSVFTILMSDQVIFWLVIAVMAKFCVSEILLRTHSKSARMSKMFEAADRSRDASILIRFNWSAVLVTIDFLRALAILGFFIGKDSNWSATRKFKENIE